MGKTNLLKTNWTSGKKWKALAEALNLFGVLLNNITIDNRPAEVTRRGINLKSNPSVSNPFTGYYRFKGKRYYIDISNPHPYWYHDTIDNEGHWSDSPIPDPMPSTQYWRVTEYSKPEEPILC